MPAAVAKMLGIDLSSRKEEKLSSGSGLSALWPTDSTGDRRIGIRPASFRETEDSL